MEAPPAENVIARCITFMIQMQEVIQNIHMQHLQGRIDESLIGLVTEMQLVLDQYVTESAEVSKKDKASQPNALKNICNGEDPLTNFNGPVLSRVDKDSSIDIDIILPASTNSIQLVTVRVPLWAYEGNFHHTIITAKFICSLHVPESKLQDMLQEYVNVSLGNIRRPKSPKYEPVLKCPRIESSGNETDDNDTCYQVLESSESDEEAEEESESVLDTPVEHELETNEAVDMPEESDYDNMKENVFPPPLHVVVATEKLEYHPLIHYTCVQSAVNPDAIKIFKCQADKQLQEVPVRVIKAVPICARNLNQRIRTQNSDVIQPSETNINKTEPCKSDDTNNKSPAEEETTSDSDSDW